MTPLPIQSRASATKGLWFVFKDGEHFIRAWGSYWTGIERIYFDEQLVLHSPTRAQAYEFTRAANHYRVEFCNQSVAIGQLHCAFYKNGQLHSSVRSKRRKVINIRPIYAHIGACLGFGLAAGLLHLPPWSGFICIMLSFAITVLSNAKKDDFIIEESQPS